MEPRYFIGVIMDVLKDVRYALRRWRRRPGFAVAAILTLALGIAATTAIFSVVDAVLLRPLPWTAPGRLVVIHAVFPERRQNPATAATWNRGLLSWPAWDGLQRAPVFETVGVWIRPRPDATFGKERAELVSTMQVSSNFLPMLGVRVVHGRHFTKAEDEKPTNSVILSHETWQRRFGGRPEIVGESLVLGSASAGGQQTKTIVGVLQRDFRFEGQPPEFILPVGYGAETGRTYLSGWFRAVARLAPGVPLESAVPVAESVVRAAETKEPASARLVPLLEEQLGNTARPLWLLFGGAGLLLLVACSNVAGLLLGEARARRHEIAVRTALGGSRARVVRQLGVEHFLLAAAGAAAGLVLAGWLTQSLVAIAPEGLPRLETVAVDLRVAAFALGLGFLTLLLFGVAPALSLARTPAAQVLAEGGRDATSRRHLGQRVIVAGQIALALVLLVGAGLFGETIFRLTSQPLGFNPSNLAIASTAFTGPRFGAEGGRILREASAARRPDFRELMLNLGLSVGTARTASVIDRLSALPAVIDAAGVSHAPFIVAPFTVEIRVEGRPAGDVYQAQRQTVTDGYFKTMGMPILQGRGFEPSDRPGAYVAVISQEFERRFLSEGALGRRFAYPWAPDRSTTYEVVGVVPSVKQREFSDDERATFYVLDRQSGAVTHFVTRTSGDAGAMLPLMRRTITDVNPQIVVTATNTMAGMLARSTAEERFRATLSALFGAAALVLAAVGLYGLAARRVADRRREIGVRVALGARPANIRALVLKDALVIVGFGLIAGLPAAFGASQVTRTLLFGVSPASPHIFVVTSAVLAAAAMAATLGPARRATRFDPMLALKE